MAHPLDLLERGREAAIRAGEEGDAPVGGGLDRERGERARGIEAAEQIELLPRPQIAWPQMRPDRRDGGMRLGRGEPGPAEQGKQRVAPPDLEARSMGSSASPGRRAAWSLGSALVASLATNGPSSSSAAASCGAVRSRAATSLANTARRRGITLRIHGVGRGRSHTRPPAQGVSTAQRMAGMRPRAGAEGLLAAWIVPGLPHR